MRLTALGWFPSPAGDEGNWALLALALAGGEGRVALAPDAAFVSLLFARLAAVSIGLLGPSFHALRLPGALLAIATVGIAFALVRRVATRRAALFVAAVVTLHPWCVAYSRVAAVPYDLAFATMLIGPLLLLAGLEERRAWVIAAAIQVVALGAHFSPLTVCAAVACGIVLASPSNRWCWRATPIWASIGLAAAHSLPVVFSASAIARELPARAPLDDFAAKLAAYAHLTLTGLSAKPRCGTSRTPRSLPTRRS